jgi:hypothetical protein
MYPECSMRALCAATEGVQGRLLDRWHRAPVRSRGLLVADRRRVVYRRDLLTVAAVLFAGLLKELSPQTERLSKWSAIIRLPQGSPSSAWAARQR